MLDTLDFKSVSVKMSLRLPRLKHNENTLGCSEDTKRFPLSFKEGGKRSFFLSAFCLPHDLSLYRGDSLTHPLSILAFVKF